MGEISMKSRKPKHQEPVAPTFLENVTEDKFLKASSLLLRNLNSHSQVNELDAALTMWHYAYGMMLERKKLQEIVDFYESAVPWIIKKAAEIRSKVE